MTDGGAVGLVARSHHGATLQCGSVGNVASVERAGWQCSGVGKVASAEHAGWQCGGPWVASRWAVRRQLPDRGWLGGSVAPWRDPTLRQCGQSGIGGACRVAVRQCGQSGIGGACRVAAVRRTGGSGVGTVSTVGLVARSHHGATLHCGSVALR